MNHWIMLANIGDDLADVARTTAESFGFNWPHFFAQVVSFSIVAFLLHRFAYQPIINVLEERRERIAQSLANAEKIKAELAKTEAARAEIIGKANTQSNEMIEEARAAAVKVLQHETEKAIHSAEQIIAQAREAAEADRQQMMAELRKEIGQLVVRTTAKVADKILTPEDQQRLVEETNRQIAN